MPTINSYKRLSGGEAFWAPNAVTYGYDSRAASIRIISPPSAPPSATRLEVRVPGADMNPYFALSGIFLLGLRGIEKKMKLTSSPISHFTPEDKRTGKVILLLCINAIPRAYEDQVKMLPASLEAATIRMMKPDSIAREEGMLGNVFVEHYGGTREHEVKLWNEAVTNWEGKQGNIAYLNTAELSSDSGTLHGIGIIFQHISHCIYKRDVCLGPQHIY